jgi:serine/threonine protein kinase
MKLDPLARKAQKDAILKEYAFSKLAGHLGVKPPVFDEDTNRCYITMKRMPGQDLFDVWESGDIRDDQLLELTQTLLKALKTQVIDKGIVHRDLKLENIRVAMTTPISVNIMDFGLAKKSGEDDGQYPGSPTWAAFELFMGNAHDTPVDIFSMGRILALLWGQSQDSYTDDFFPHLQSKNAHKTLDLSEDKKWIEPLLRQMLQPEPALRIKIDEAIQLLNHLTIKDLKCVEVVDHRSDRNDDIEDVIMASCFIM